MKILTFAGVLLSSLLVQANQCRFINSESRCSYSVNFVAPEKTYMGCEINGSPNLIIRPLNMGLIAINSENYINFWLPAIGSFYAVPLLSSSTAKVMACGRNFGGGPNRDCSSVKYFADTESVLICN